jgi:hypothetical protein
MLDWFKTAQRDDGIFVLYRQRYEELQARPQGRANVVVNLEESIVWIKLIGASADDDRITSRRAAGQPRSPMICSLRLEALAVEFQRAAVFGHRAHELVGGAVRQTCVGRIGIPVDLI